jgi:3-isopropylmalate/(R)-2-methylmalate dehydratase small subunit
MQSVFTGPVFVVGDNIDTDQIIPAQYLNLVPTIPEEYEKLGAYAFAGLPESGYATRYVKEGQLDSDYPIVVAGRNFGCGSSREHAPVAIKASGVSVVVASSFARIFYRNSINTGLPIVICPAAAMEAKSGDTLRVDLVAGTVENLTQGTRHDADPFPPFMQELIDRGGLLEYVKSRVAAGSA